MRDEGNKSMHGKTKVAKADFETWLARMDSRLKEFVETLPEDIQRQLDYTPESLDIIEAWIIRTYPTAQAMIDDFASPTVDGITRYIGETFRRNIEECYWTIELKHPNFAYFGVPILDGGEDYPIEDSPRSMAATAADRRTGKVLRKILEGAKSSRQFYRGKMRIVGITSRAKFDEWASEMDNAIEYYLATLPGPVRSQLNYSLDSLSILEKWLYEKYPNNVPWMEDPEIYDGAARYVGETFLRNVGGRWDVNLTNPRFAFNHIPIIRGSQERPYLKCPVVMVGMARRTGTYMRKQLETIMKRPQRG